MLIPPPPIWRAGETLGEQLERAGVSRRDLLKFAGRMATLIAMGPLLPGQTPASAETIADKLAVGEEAERGLAAVAGVHRAASNRRCARATPRSRSSSSTSSRSTTASS